MKREKKYDKTCANGDKMGTGVNGVGRVGGVSGENGTSMNGGGGGGGGAATANSGISYMEYVSKFVVQKGESFSHTRIPDRSLSIGGAFMIPKNELPEFYARYYRHVFVDKKQEFLTEKQQQSNGPGLVDFDFRYPPDTESRIHTKENIMDVVSAYMQIITSVYKFPAGDQDDAAVIPFYIFEKPTVNIQSDFTKDGIHMLIGMKMERAVQMLLREELLHELPEILSSLPLINTWEQVYDDGIVKGHTNWQLYGSRKPNNKAYDLKYIFEMKQNSKDKTWYCSESSVSDFVKDMERNLVKLTAQYDSHPEYETLKLTDDDDEMVDVEMQHTLLKRLDSIRLSLQTSQLAASRRKNAILNSGGANAGTGLGPNSPGASTRIIMRAPDETLGTPQRSTPWTLEDIKTLQDLQDATEQMLSTIDTKEYELRNTHEYVMILPQEYYEEYTKWLHVGFALNNTSPRLFLSWMLFSSQWSRFSVNDIHKHLLTWRGFSYNPSGLTNRSIRYWARRDAPDKYSKVHDLSIDHYIEETIKTDQATDFDLAMVVYQVFKEHFVCASVGKNIWYEFSNHRWVECDEGNTLRLFISRDIYRIYYRKLQLLMDELRRYETGSEQFVHIKKLTEKITAINVKLKTTTYKNNIMREVKTLFYDKKFYDNLNSNPYLLCFKNGVMDFKQKCFRDGQPDDNISKCTNIEYVKLDASSAHKTEVAEIMDFMSQLFPIEPVRRYMWEHLASVLIGVNRDQTFNVYIGGGSNGKSKLVELMALCLGDYKVSLPIALITQKRIGIGSTSSEIAQLVGVRYAVMQEPTKSDNTLNDGVLKELTGGDPVTARALYKDSITFVPQCKLAVCTNVMFNLETNDDGTKRRIKKIDFISKFCERPVQGDKDSPYQFMMNKYLDENLKRWAGIFMSMLVDKAVQTGGVVTTCKEVEDSSNAYFESEDHISEFINEKIQAFEGGVVRSGDLNETFKKWYRTHHDREVPKPKDLYSVMDKRFGKRGTLKAWKNICIIQDDEYAKDETFGEIDSDELDIETASACSVEVITAKNKK
jgi:P4 family phage/plasmid primase-like protien